jgi:hypothetical protein
MGSALVPPGLHAVGDEEWGALLTRLAAALAPPGITAGLTAQTTAQTRTPQ